ncbi:hypothetical protein MBANPS3_003220 [Mucor bainieri]
MIDSPDHMIALKNSESLSFDSRRRRSSTPMFNHHQQANYTMSNHQLASTHTDIIAEYNNTTSTALLPQSPAAAAAGHLQHIPSQGSMTKLIDVDSPPLGPTAAPPTEVIHISLAEITGGYIYDPIKCQQRSQRMVQVQAYIDRCNDKHNQLMNQVANVRLYYKQIMYS